MTAVLDQASGPAGRPSDEALTVRQAAKTFGGVQVLRGVSLSLKPGELRALVGENGSGKSTFVKLLAGYHEAEPGAEFVVGGQAILPHQPGVSDEAGLRFVHQDLALVDTLSTVENLGLGRGYGSRIGRPVSWARLRDEARSAMLELGYDIDVERPVASLGASERTAVAVARAVSQHHSPPRVLVLDEPTASLPGPEVERLFALVRRVTASGVAVLFVSHHLTEVFEIADSVSVLRGGDLVTTRPVAGLTEEGLIELMIGRAVPRTGQGAAVAGTAPVVLATTGLAGDSVLGLDLSVSAGEIIGIAGITGSGREAVAPLLFGARPRTGVVTIGADALRSGRPDLSVAAGMALIPAERARNASVGGHDVGENVTIARPRDFMRRGVFRRRLEAEEVTTWLQRLDVRPRKPRMPLSQLSGGNAQKVILARWLRLEPTVLVLDEPTQGVDVGAKEDIHQRIDETAAGGCAVVVCSTDSEELARLCSRVIVLVRGRAAVQLRAPLHPDDITAASLGATRGTSA